MSRKRLIILSPVILTILLAAIMLPLSSSSRNRERHEPARPKIISLNDSLTNEMSSIPGLEGMDNTIEKFLKRWEIKGASIAVMRNDSLLYAKGYGYADEEKGEMMEPGNILRMASVSKLITATGIMLLQEQGAFVRKSGPSEAGPCFRLEEEAGLEALGGLDNADSLTIEVAGDFPSFS